MDLQHYRFSVELRAGVLHLEADAMSRLFHEIDEPKGKEELCKMSGI
jgi:hypothetical protein